MSSENNEKINIIDLTNKIAHITKSANKNDFIKNYNEYHNKIKKFLISFKDLISKSALISELKSSTCNNEHT